MNYPRLGTLLASILCLLSCSLGLTGCGETEEQALKRISTMSQTNLVGAQGEIIKCWRAGTITLNETLNLAHTQVDKNQPGCLTMAKATLDAIHDLSPEIEKKGVNEFFWMRVGTLAGNSAGLAYNAGDTPTAMSLVLAGPSQWQNDNYWLRNPNHDALACYILHSSGQTQEALARIARRPEIDPLLQKAQEDISHDQRLQAAKAAAIAAEEARQKKKKR